MSCTTIQQVTLCQKLCLHMKDIIQPSEQQVHYVHCAASNKQWSYFQRCEFFCRVVHSPVKAVVDWILKRDRDQVWPFQNLVIIGATKTNWSANQEDTTKQLIIILPNLQRAIFHRRWLAEELIGRRIIAWGSLLPYTVICGPIWQISPLWSLIFPILIFSF